MISDEEPDTCEEGEHEAWTVSRETPVQAIESCVLQVHESLLREHASQVGRCSLHFLRLWRPGCELVVEQCTIRNFLRDVGLIGERCSHVRQPVLVRSFGGGRRLGACVNGTVTTEEVGCILHRKEDCVLFNGHQLRDRWRFVVLA